MQELTAQTTVVKVTHIGQDYGKIEVTIKGHTLNEYEVPLLLALALKEVL